MRRSPVFIAALVIKGFNGIWETASGVLVLALGSQWLASSYNTLAQGELLEDPRDRLVSITSRILQGASSSAIKFAAAYVLLHGLLNIFLSIQLLRRRHWAYPVAIAINLAAMAYQVHRIALHHSATLTVVTLVDVVFVLLALREYRSQRVEYPPAQS